MDPISLLALIAAAAGSAAAADAWEKLRSLVRRRLTHGQADAARAEGGDTAGDQDGLDEMIFAAQHRDLTLEGRLSELADLMSRSSILTEQVSAELEARAATAKRLQEEARQAEKLASINKEQADAIRRLMDAELAAKLTDNGAAIRKDIRKDSIRIGVGSFIAGGGVSLAITLLVHPLH